MVLASAADLQTVDRVVVEVRIKATTNHLVFAPQTTRTNNDRVKQHRSNDFLDDHS